MGPLEGCICVILANCNWFDNCSHVLANAPVSAEIIAVSMSAERSRATVRVLEAVKAGARVRAGGQSER